jgi:flagellar protein FlgJ
MTTINSSSVYNDLSSLQTLKAQSADKPQEALQEAAKQFESLFVTMMVKAMRDTLPKDGMFASSNMESYQEMFDQQLSLDLSRKGGLGMADLIARQMSAGMGWDTDAASGADAGTDAGTDVGTTQE